MWDGIPPLVLHKNSDLLAKPDLAKAEATSNYFSEVYHTSVVKITCRNHTPESPAIGPIHVTGKTVLQSTINLKPGKIPGHDGLQLRMLSSFADITSGPLVILLSMSLPQSQPPKD